MLTVPSGELPKLRLLLRRKYAIQSFADPDAPDKKVTANALLQVAGTLDGMVKRAERGRGSINALRAAVDNVSTSHSA